MDRSNPREMFDNLPEETWVELKELANKIGEIIDKYYDAHTEVNIKTGELVIKRDVVNAYVK